MNTHDRYTWKVEITSVHEAQGALDKLTVGTWEIHSIHTMHTPTMPGEADETKLVIVARQLESVRHYFNDIDTKKRFEGKAPRTAFYSPACGNPSSKKLVEAGAEFGRCPECEHNDWITVSAEES